MARVTVGIGQIAVSVRPRDVLVTHALGSCLAVAVYDPEPPVAGLLHAVLPAIALERGGEEANPAQFVDSGIALLLQAVEAAGGDPRRLLVRVVGGGSILREEDGNSIGARNLLAALRTLRGLGLSITSSHVGGRLPRTVHLSVADGRTRVFSPAGGYEMPGTIRQRGSA